MRVVSRDNRPCGLFLFVGDKPASIPADAKFRPVAHDVGVRRTRCQSEIHAQNLIKQGLLLFPSFGNINVGAVEGEQSIWLSAVATLRENPRPFENVHSPNIPKKRR